MRTMCTIMRTIRTILYSSLNLRVGCASSARNSNGTASDVLVLAGLPPGGPVRSTVKNVNVLPVVEVRWTGTGKHAILPD